MKLVNSPECSRCKCASRTALCDLYNCMALATLWVRHLGWRFMKLGGFEDISVSRTRCGAAECLSKGLHKRVMTKCTGYYGVCPSTFFSLLFYFKPLILYSCHLSYSIILHTHQNNVSQIVHFPVFYTILGGHHKNVKLEFYCIHNFTTAGHKVDIIVTPCIHNIPPLHSSTACLQWYQLSLTSVHYISNTSSKTSKYSYLTCPTYYTPYSKQSTFSGDKITWPNNFKVRKQ